MLYIIYITRIMLIFIFLYSFVTKLRDFAAFERAIKNFQLLPSNLHRLVSISFVLGEAFIVVTAIFGGNWLFQSYSMAIILLVIFIYALNSVLKRDIQASCNCFGVSEQKVSHYDIWRNIGIVMIPTIGFIALSFNNTMSNLGLLAWLLSTIVAFVLSIFLLNLRDLMELVA